MNWVKPHFKNLRLGYEVTGYVDQITRPTETLSVAKTATQEPQHAHKPNVLYHNGHRTVKQAALAVCTSLLLMVSGLSYAAQGTWRFVGGDMHNTANNETEKEISPANVSQLVPKFVYKTAPDGQVGDVKHSVILGNKVYFSDLAGNLTALDNRTGTLLWKKNFLADYTPLLHGLDNNIPVGAVVKYGWSSPAIIGGLLIIGSGTNLAQDNLNETGAVLMGINRHTGALVWAKQIDDHPTAIITQAPVAKGNTVYVGVSSIESGSVIKTGGTDGPVVLPLTGKIYSCCSFRGSMVAVNATNGQIIWKFHTVPNAPGEPAGALNDWTLRHTGIGESWSGNSVWGSTPVIDLARGLLYFGTGQTHTIPNDVAIQNNLAFPSAPFVQLTPNAYPSSIPAGNYPASIIALNLKDGTVKWSKAFGKLRGFDGWNAACVSFFIIPGVIDNFASMPYCPVNNDYSATDPLYDLFVQNRPFDFSITAALMGTPIPLTPNGDISNVPVPFPSGATSWDHDFGQGPMLVKNVLMPNGSKKDLLIAAQKNGVTRALDPSTGAVLWQTYSGTGGFEGGHEFGSATDGKRVYLASNRDIMHDFGVNIFGIADPGSVILKDGTPTNGAGYFSALDIRTGQILWETKAPFGAGAVSLFTGAFGDAEVTGMMSVANGVVYGFVNDYNGTLVALDAATGQILLEYPTADAAGGHPGEMRAQRANIVNGAVYLGTGGAQLHGIGNNKFISLTLPSHQTYADDNSSDDNNDNNADGNDAQ